MKIALIGDSHTTAYFPPLRSKLEAAGHQVVGQVSNVGWAVYSYNSKPEQIEAAISGDPDVVLVSLGGNNSRLDNERYGAAVKEFLDRIGYPQRKVIWVGAAIATRPDVDRRHRWTVEWMKNNLPKDIAFIDAEQFTQTGHRDDGVHFTMVFYRDVWAEEVAKQTLSFIRLPIVLYKAKQKLPLILFILSMGGLSYALWRRYGKTE